MRIKDLDQTIIKKKLFRNFTFSYIEPEEIILQFTAKMYNVNIELVSVDGSINKNENRKLPISKKIYYAEENKNENLPKINLFYNLNCFFKSYTIKDYAENLNIYKRFASKIREIFFEESEFDCNFCNKMKNNKKIFFKNQLICACIECIRLKADSIMNKRFFNFQKDCFLSRECNFFL